MNDELVTEATTYTSHKKHNRQTTIPSTGFEPVIPVTEQPQTYTLDSMATRISLPTDIPTLLLVSSDRNAADPGGQVI